MKLCTCSLISCSCVLIHTCFSGLTFFYHYLSSFIVIHTYFFIQICKLSFELVCFIYIYLLSFTIVLYRSQLYNHIHLWLFSFAIVHPDLQLFMSIHICFFSFSIVPYYWHLFIAVRICSGRSELFIIIHTYFFSFRLVHLDPNLSIVIPNQKNSVTISVSGLFKLVMPASAMSAGSEKTTMNLFPSKVSSGRWVHAPPSCAKIWSSPLTEIYFQSMSPSER
jgi:hypothetical protein